MCLGPFGAKPRHRLDLFTNSTRSRIVLNRYLFKRKIALEDRLARLQPCNS